MMCCLNGQGTPHLRTTAFLPHSCLQLEMRKKFLGEAFWVRKMHLFNETKGNIIKSADGSASKAVGQQIPSAINSIHHLRLFHPM